jgi:hypothetical protein
MGPFLMPGSIAMSAKQPFRLPSRQWAALNTPQTP